MDIEDAFSNVNLAKLKEIAEKLKIPRQYVAWIVKCYQGREITVETVDGNKTRKTNEGFPDGRCIEPNDFSPVHDKHFWNESRGHRIIPIRR